jgi:hypothetical protein
VGIWVGVTTIEQGNDLQAENNRLQRAQLDSHLEEVMMSVDRHFVSYPRLRQFFYATRHPQRFPPPGVTRAQAMGTAELIIDFADDVGAYVRMRRMAPSDAWRWTEIVRSYFRESPAIRSAWYLFHAPYEVTTACVLGAPYGSELDGWKWRTNRPEAEWARACRRKALVRRVESLKSAN